MRALHVHASCAELVHSRALARAAGAGARLRALEVEHPVLGLHDIAALAMLPGLERLAVNITRAEPSDTDTREDDLRLQSLLAHYAAGGLQIKLSASIRDSVVVPPFVCW